MAGPSRLRSKQDLPVGIQQAGDPVSTDSADRRLHRNIQVHPPNVEIHDVLAIDGKYVADPSGHHVADLVTGLEKFPVVPVPTRLWSPGGRNRPSNGRSRTCPGRCWRTSHVDAVAHDRPTARVVGQVQDVNESLAAAVEIDECADHAWLRHAGHPARDPVAEGKALASLIE